MVQQTYCQIALCRRFGTANPENRYSKSIREPCKFKEVKKLSENTARRALQFEEVYDDTLDMIFIDEEHRDFFFMSLGNHPQKKNKAAI